MYGQPLADTKLAKFRRSNVPMSWAQWIGLEKSSYTINYEPQAIESSGFEQLQSIYKDLCHWNRCAGSATTLNPRKLSKMSR